MDKHCACRYDQKGIVTSHPLTISLSGCNDAYSINRQEKEVRPLKTQYNRLAELVLPKDLELANKLHDCMVKYVHNIFNAKSKEVADRWDEELIRCSKDFMKLREAKQDYEASKSYCVIITDFRARGINASLVTRKK